MKPPMRPRKMQTWNNNLFLAKDRTYYLQQQLQTKHKEAQQQAQVENDLMNQIDLKCREMSLLGWSVSFATEKWIEWGKSNVLSEWDTGILWSCQWHPMVTIWSQHPMWIDADHACWTISLLQPGSYSWCNQKLQEDWALCWQCNAWKQCHNSDPWPD